MEWIYRMIKLCKTIIGSGLFDYLSERDESDESGVCLISHI